MTRYCSACARFSFATIAFLACSLLTVVPMDSFGQESSQQMDRDRVASDRYLEVLLRRPRPGVALDRVYGYHVQNDSLDELREQLVDSDESDAGQRQMVWGLIELQRGRSAEAAAILADAESKLVDDAACSFYLGRAYLAIGQTERAAEAMERAIDRDPSRVEAMPMFTELGRIYSRAGEHEKSLSVWTRLESMFPGDTRVGGQIARTLAEEGNFAEAKKRYETLAETTQKSDEKIAFAVEAAELHRKLGNPSEATASLERILARLNPDSWLYTDVRNRIEAGFLKSGDYDALAEYYQLQLTTRPDDVPLQTRLSRILITAGRLNEARTMLMSVIERAPDDIDARLTLIDVLVDQNDVAQAARQFEQLVRRDPDNPDHLIRWGQVLLDDTETPIEDRRSAAATVWSRLADARPDDAVTLAQIADLMRGIDRSDDAISLYQRSIKIDPTSPQYREYLGEYLYSLDRKSEAIDVWNSIAAEDRRDRENLVRLAEVFAAFKLPDLALDTWRQASEFDLTFAQELRYASKLADANRYDEALSRLDTAAEIAETPDEQEQLLKERISLYQTSGTLEEQIRKIAAEPETVTSLRKLALMYGAAGDLTGAQRSIQKAIAVEPENPDVLLVAADLAERQNRFGDAAALFQKLAEADSRYRTNYLQRVASLRIRLGQVDEAMEICDEIIDANPASTESYQFLARTAFGVNRDEEGITALRRAMTVAPRDNAPRRMLAAHFAERYRTDEAIELYWQAFRLEPQLDDRINVIRALAPLYDRKTDLDSLIGRIEEFNRQDGNARAANLMIAAAHESVQDFGAASNVIDQLLAAQPRDVALLETAVRLSDMAGEVELAAEYQRRITELANTPENRFKLVQLELDAGLIDVKEALSQRLSFVSDPSRLGSMIRAAAGRGDLTTAREICEQALRDDDTLWDVKLTLAQLLLLGSGSDNAASERDRALTIAREVRSADVPMDTPPPTRRIQATVQQSVNSPSASYLSNPMYWSQSSHQLASMLRVGRYANGSYSSSSNVMPVEPSSYGHARIIAASLVLIEAVDETEKDATTAIQEILESEFPLPEIGEETDAIALWERFVLMTVISSVTSNTFGNLYGPVPSGLAPAAKAEAEQLRKTHMKLLWRLAELDPNYGMMPLFQYLSRRMMSERMPTSQQVDMTPLSDDELELLAQINERVQASAMPAAMMMGATAGAAEMMLQTILGNEFHLAGKVEEAAKYAPQDPDHDASYDEVVGAIQFYLQLQNHDKAGELVKHLLPAARREKSNAAVQGTSPITQVMMRGGQEAKAFYQEHEVPLVDAVIANWAKTASNATGQTTLGDGYVTAYTQYRGGLRSMRIRGPLSPRLMDSTLAQQVLAFSVVTATSAADTSSSPQGELSSELIAHLQAPLAGASAAEQKIRHVVAAFAHWWANRPDQCYQQLVKLCEEFPADVELQIERARLASELRQPRLALETLDSFSPLDSRMLVRKEMAAMNLAAEIGDAERAQVAAERLFGMRLDVQTQLALADQLKRLGLTEQSNAMLRRTRSGRARDENTELQIARAFYSAGDQDAAAEVAYSLLRRLASGRSTRSNVTSYQQQAVSILQSTGRLEPLIERARRRVESSPKALRPKQELAELYVAAGRSDEANQVWESLAEDVPVNAQQMIVRADALVKARKIKESVELYLDAFEKDPTRFNNDFYKMYNAARSAGEETIDAVYRRLMHFPIEDIPVYRMDDLARMGSRSKLSDAKRDFIERILKSPLAETQVYGIVRNIPDDQRNSIPGYRDAMMRAICSDEAFSASSSIWYIQSRSSGGTAIGPLQDMLNLLQNDADAEQRFRAAAGEALEVDTRKTTAIFMLALLDTNRPDQLQECLKVMQACIKHDPDDADAPVRVHSGLLWQAGQILESIESVPIDFLIEIYSEAKRNDTTASSGPQFSVDSRLVDTYVKANRYEDARELLLRLHKNVDYSNRSQYPAGYSDYQQLQTDQWVAEKLMLCNAPIDALIIYRGGLSDPDRFEQARRWGGSRNLKEVFESRAEDTAKAITPPMASEHLMHQLKLWETDVVANPVELMESAAASIATSDSPSSIALAIRVAVSSDSTRATVEEFAERVAKLAAAHDESWQLAALQLMTACYLGLDNATEVEATLFKRLPKESDLVGDDSRALDSVESNALFDLYPVARAASRSSRESDQETGKRLVNYLSRVAESANDTSIALALAEISGDASESITRILDVISSQSKSDSPLGPELVEQCLQAAKDAALAGDVATSARALKLALQNGPPLRKMSVGGDAFAITTSRAQPTIIGREEQTDMDHLADKLAEVTASLGEACGVALIYQKGADAKRQSNRVDDELLGQLADTFLAILAPASRPGVVYSYSNKIATSSYDRIRSDEDMLITSASMALARVAAQSGRSEELTAALQTRLRTAADKTEPSIALAQIAFAAGRSDRLAEALDQFTEAIGSRLPKDVTQSRSAPPVTTITSQIAAESQQKSEVVNLVLHAIWPILASDMLMDPANKGDESIARVASKVVTLMMRTEALINSDSYTANRHREIRRRLTEQQVAIAKMSGDVAVVDEYIRSELDSIETRSYPSGSNLQEYKRRALEQMVFKMIDDGLIERMDPVFRHAIKTHSGRNRDYANRFEPQVCLAISQMPADKRVDLLEKVTFGHNGDEPIAYFDGLVSYEIPPPLVSRQQPMLGAVMNLGTCSEDYPIVNSYLMLIDAAAQLEQTESLERKLDAQIKAAGDEADIALALLKLAIANADDKDSSEVLQSIRPTLDAVQTRLSKDLPQKVDQNLVFPTMETHLIVRAFQAGVPASILAPMIRDAKVFAVRGQRNYMISAVARVTAKMGLGRASGATDRSPLEHFEIIPTVARNRGDNAGLRPLYAVDRRGWISGTGGYDQSLLMFKYPLAGSFTFSAEIEDGNWGEADLAYGGAVYQANGWQQTARVLGMGNRGDVEFKVDSIDQGKPNVESVSVSPQEIQALCNGQPYVTDTATGSYPFVSVHHHRYRTTRFRDLKFSGSPAIPDEVNLIDPTMRGWATLTRGKSIPKMLMPIGPKQNEKQILQFREKMAADLAEGPLVGGWSVREQQLHYQGEPSGSRTYDPPSHIEYLRPFQPGESIHIEFFWKAGDTEFAPTIGRTILQLGSEGTKPDWIAVNADLASVDFISAANLDPPYEPIAPDNTPQEDQWNTLVMKRVGDRVAVTLNGKPVIEVPVAGHERPGIYRYEKRDLIIRSMRLTGDWPDQVPAELMAD